MIFKELTLVYFGKFKNKTIELEDGLNIIYGDNESGKTTIHKFIEGMLFGFFKPYSKIRRYTEDYDRYYPWYDNNYFGVMKYIYDGYTYRVERNFIKGSDEVRMYDDRTGEDITNIFEYDPVLRLYSPCSRTMGINSIVYNNTISIGQLKNKTDSDIAKEVKDKLINIGGSLDEEISVKNALDYLEKEIASIGTKDRVKGSDYGKSYFKLKKLEQERKKALNYTKEIEAYKERLGSIRRETFLLQNQRKKLAKELNMLKKYEAKKRYDKALNLKDEIQNIDIKVSELKKYEKYQKEDLIQLIALIKEKESTKSNQEEVDQLIENVLQDISIAEEELNGLNKFDDIDDDDFDNFVEHIKELEQKKKRLEDVDKEIKKIDQDMGENTQGFERELIDDIYCFEGKEEERNRLLLNKEYSNVLFLKSRIDEKEKGANRFKILTFIFIFLIAVTVYLGINFDNSMFYVLAVFPATLMIYCIYEIREIKEYIDITRVQVDDSENEEQKKNKKVRVLNEEMKAILDKYRCSSKIELKKLLDINYAKSLNSKANNNILEKLKWNKEELANEIKDIKSSMGKYYDKLGVKDNVEVKNIQVLEKEHLKYNAIIEKSKYLRNELKNLYEKKSNLLKKEKELEFDIKRIFNEFNISSIEEFQEGIEKKKELEISLNNLKNKKELFNDILGNYNLDYLKELSCECNSEERNFKFDTRELSINIEHLDESISSQGMESTRMEEKINNLMSSFRPLVEIEEDIDRERRSIEYYERKLEVLNLTKNTIEDISKKIQKDFAPTLNDTVGNLIKDITDERYKEVKITENIEISVVDPKSNSLIPINRLSGGTIDQLYFATRFGIIDTIKENEGLPLILDDCFIQYDNNRLENALKFLYRESKNRQVILFTCQKREKNILNNLKMEYNYIYLS